MYEHAAPISELGVENWVEKKEFPTLAETVRRRRRRRDDRRQQRMVGWLVGCVLRGRSMRLKGNCLIPHASHSSVA